MASAPAASLWPHPICRPLSHHDEAIAYHEGVPGHHMQLSVQQQLRTAQVPLTVWASTLMWKVGALRRTTRQRDRLLPGPASDYGRSPLNFSAPCVWSSIPESMRKGWTAIRLWISCASPALWMSQRSSLRPIGTLLACAGA